MLKLTFLYRRLMNDGDNFSDHEKHESQVIDKKV